MDSVTTFHKELDTTRQCYLLAFCPRVYQEHQKTYVNFHKKCLCNAEKVIVAVYVYNTQCATTASHLHKFMRLS